MTTKCCTSCYATKPIDDFYLKSSRNPSTGNVSKYREGQCKQCANIKKTASRRNRPKAVRVVEAKPLPRYIPPRPAEEVPCDTAFMQWAGGEPRQDWRVRL